ncbi:MAG: molybdenum cofactor guanylyltransferase [Candidatus Bathyarchaeota archaeon]|nr:molybdenum cofactor guanylyltransferase [Candidatus Bathyarchaeota archaeon]
MAGRSGVILAGGTSSRVGFDKGLHMLRGKPIISRVIESLNGVVGDIMVVVGSDEMRRVYQPVVGESVKVLVDKYGAGSPLIGLITGLGKSSGEYVVVAACDMPFIEPDLIELLFDKALGHDGAVYVKPNGWIEPLLAVYRVDVCLAEAERLYRAGDLRLRMVLRNLSDVVYLPVSEAEAIDPGLRSFFDADTEEKLITALKIIKDEML